MPRLPSKQKRPDVPVPTVPLGLMLMLVFAFAFFGLLTVIFPGIGFIGLAVLLGGLFFWLQYIVWGRWLYGVVVRMEQKEQESAFTESVAPAAGARGDGNSDEQAAANPQ